MANYSRNGGRGGGRAVEGIKVMRGAFEDMKRNKTITVRRRRSLERKLVRDARP
jgi:hypothetical protein